MSDAFAIDGVGPELELKLDPDEVSRAYRLAIRHVKKQESRIARHAKRSAVKSRKLPPRTRGGEGVFRTAHAVRAASPRR